MHEAKHEDVDKMKISLEIIQYFDINPLRHPLIDADEKLLSVYICKQLFFIVPQDSIYNNLDRKDAVIAIIDVIKSDDDDNETFALRI